MATIVDPRTQAPLPLGYDPLRYSTIPQFTDPWAQTSRPTSNALYNGLSATSQSQQQQLPSSRNDSISSAYSSAAYPSASDSLQQQAKAIYYNNGYSSAPTQAYAPIPAARYSLDSYQAPTSYAYDQLRRGSYPVKPQLMGRDSYAEALDASQGMVAMSQDITPRAPFGRTGSIDSYGFPTHHSQSSISSSTGYPQYYHGSYSGSIDGSVASSSVTDYGSEAENALASRNMPMAAAMGHSFHQDQAAMMTQFNSKMSASAQKKHKCKVCEKRFTRPSSLQTHMYSHTGEKPFACDFDGCGRHFSVVSNLRRHKKCHKSGGEHPCSDGERHSDA